MSRPWLSTLRSLLAVGIAASLLSCSASAPSECTQQVTEPDGADQLPSPAQAVELLRAASADWELGEMLTYGTFYLDVLPHQHVTQSLYSCVFEAEWEAQGPQPANMAHAIIPVFITEPGAEPELWAQWSAPPSEAGCYVGLADYAENAWEWHRGTLQGGIALKSFAPYDHPTEDYVLVIVCVIEDAPAALDWVRFGPNIEPAADIDVDSEYGLSPATFSFDMSDSIDPELSIDHYEWDFENDGSFETPEPNLPQASHEFTAHGMHTVVGKVVDEDGAEGTDAVEVWVSRFAVEELDSTGHSPDAYVDGAGVIQVSYGAGAELNVLRHGQLDGASWSTEDRDTLAGDENIETAIAPFEAVDWVLFAYGRDKFYAGAWKGTEFTVETLSEDWSPGRPAMAVDGDDRPHVLGTDAYGEFPLQQQHCTHWYLDIGGWQRVEVNAEDQTGRYCDAVARGESLLHGAYAGPRVDDFYPVIVGSWEKPSGEPAVWTWESLSVEQHYHRRDVSLALTADSEPRVCFIGPQEDDPYNAVHYMSAHAIGSAWSDEIVGYGAWDVVMALGPDDLPHVVYTERHYDDLYKRVWYTYSDGAEWQTEYAWENPGVDMEDLVLVVDEGGAPHLLFTDRPGTGADSRLLHATFM